MIDSVTISLIGRVQGGGNVRDTAGNFGFI